MSKLAIQKKEKLNRNKVISIKKVRIVLVILLIIALLVFPVFMNILGGAAMMLNDNEDLGIMLIISSVLFIGSTVFAVIRKNLISLIMMIPGAVLAAYVIRAVSLIPNTDALVYRHLPTIAVPILTAIVILFNFLDPEAVRRRAEKRAKRIAEENRTLEDNEKIV